MHPVEAACSFHEDLALLRGADAALLVAARGADPQAAFAAVRAAVSRLPATCRELALAGHDVGFGSDHAASLALLAAGIDGLARGIARPAAKKAIMDAVSHLRTADLRLPPS